ncbi:MAG: recombinase family protein [Oscillospiraceae bacterium]
MKKKVLYQRVSSSTQKLDRQEREGFDEVYKDVCSGNIPFFDRTAGKRLKVNIDGNKIASVQVCSIDRLGRNNADILAVLEYFTTSGVRVDIENLQGFSNINQDGKRCPVFTLVTSILGAIAQTEREQIRERQAAGIALAKSRGAYLNRTCSKPVLTADQLIKKYQKSIVKQLLSGQSVRNTAKICDCSTGTVQSVRHALKQKGHL